MIELAIRKQKHVTVMSSLSRTATTIPQCIFDIRAICMDDFPSIRNIDEYTGFIYGMINCNSDIEVIFIDGILNRLAFPLKISKICRSFTISRKSTM
ncbi:MAG: hypothetical protein ACLTCI_01065 [[Clostridium] nexile]